jgi:hypothetical protein
MTTPLVDLVLASLPSTIPAGGLFTVATANQFLSETGTQSTSYSDPLMDPANIVGTDTQPYIPIALPAYVSTLYNNVYNINTNLEQDISSPATITERKYPTSYAVQAYVQSQLSGHEVINGGINGGIITDKVSSSKTNTLIRDITSIAYKYTFVRDTISYSIAMYYMDTQVNEARNGSSKLIVMGDPTYLKNAGVITGDIVVLYAGHTGEGETLKQSYFIHMGQQFRFYQFVITGDSLSFVQLYDAATSSWSWIITSSMGLFLKDTITVSGTGLAHSDTNDEGIFYPDPDIIS